MSKFNNLVGHVSNIKNLALQRRAVIKTEYEPIHGLARVSRPVLSVYNQIQQ